MSAVDELLAALDAASDDAARLALLDAAPRERREALNAQLLYRKFMDDTRAKCETERLAFEAFSQHLDAASGDAERLRLIEGAQADPQRGPVWLAEWTWRRSATVDDWRKRYLAALGTDS